MSKLSFRARALDPCKPMPIYLSEELPDLPEYSAINRAVPQMPSGMEKEEESEHHLQRAICTGLIIPTPEVFTTEQDFYDRNYPPTYKMPRQMIHMQPLGLEQDIPDYDMDSADESWVNSQMRRLDLTPLKFEQMMDRLEKSSGQTVVTLNEAKALLKQDDEVSIAVYDYWLNKRLKTQHPLILSVKTENRSGAAANNPYLAFRRRTEKMQTRKNRKNDETSYEKMLKLRRDLSRAVTLLEMVKRREKTKREQLHLSIEVFEKRYQIRDFSGTLLAELSSNVKNSRPAFAPLYTNQYSHHSSIAQSGLMSSSSASHHHYSTSQYLNSTGMVTSSSTSGAIKRDLDSGSRKEKRQYKKRKHKLQREKQFTAHSASPAAVESTIESEDEELNGNLLGGSEGEEEGPYGFRRNKSCEYHKPLTKVGNWPWETPEDDDNSLADPKYRFTLTSIRHPKPRCVGFARRRLGRGGRVILDRISTNADDLWSSLDYKIFDSDRTKELSSKNQQDIENENISRDPIYISTSTEPIIKPNQIWNNRHKNIISPLLTTNTYNNNKNNLISNMENDSISSNISNYLLNNEIKREQIDIEDVDWSRKYQQSNQQQQQQSDIVIDLVRTHCKNSNISNRNVNNNNNNNHTNYTNDNIRTILNNNSNDKVNVIKHEPLTVIKQENDTDLNILDDENVNLARLSSFINATKTSISSSSDVESEKLLKSEICDLTGQLKPNNYINNYNTTIRNTILTNDDNNRNNDNIVKTKTNLHIDCIDNSTTDNKDIIYNDFLEEIRKDWLHFRPKTPLENNSIDNNDRNDDENTSVQFSEQTRISIEVQKLGESPPSTVFTQQIENDPMFLTNLFSYNDLIPDDHIMNSITDNTSNSNTTEFNLSGDSLTELNLSLGEDDNEKMLDNILQECQIDDMKALNQTTNFWNGILDDGGGILDTIDDKKSAISAGSGSGGLGGLGGGGGGGGGSCGKDFLVNGTIEEKDGKKIGKRKSSQRIRLGSSQFSIVNSSRDEKFFRKNDIKIEQNQIIKIESRDDILTTLPQNIINTPSSSNSCCSISSSNSNSSTIQRNPSIVTVSTTPIGSTNQSTILTNKIITPKIFIKQETNQLSSSINQNQNTVLTLTNVKLDNDLSSSNRNLIQSSGGGGNIITDIGNIGGNTITTQQQTPLLVTTSNKQQQHILLQQITQSPQTQIINVSNTGLAVNDGTGTFVLAGTSTNKRHINGPTDRNAIQNILKQTKFINRKFHLSQQQTLQIKQEDDTNIGSSSGGGINQKTTATISQQQIQQAGVGNYVKMSTYPVVVSELNVQQQNSLSASAVAIASNHNYSMQPSAQPITIIGQQQQGNKIILNTSGTSSSSSSSSSSLSSGNIAGGSNFTITTPIQDLQNKIHYNPTIHTSNIKVNLLTSSGIQQGSLIVDTTKNSGHHHHQQQQHQQQQQQHVMLNQQQQQQQQRIKLDKTLNMYIDQDQKRVLYTKLVNLASLQQHKNNSGQTQTVQMTPVTAAQLLNKAHSVQRLTNAQAIVTNMRQIPINNNNNQIVTTNVGGTGIINSVSTTSTNEIVHNKQNNNNNNNNNNNSNDSTTISSATTVSGGINLNTTNR